MEIISRIFRRLAMIGRRELRMYSHRPLFLFCMIIAPLFCLVFLTSLMGKGLPTKLPAAIVDEDNTHITHTITRILGSMEEVKFVYHFSTFSEARKAMQRGEIYGFFYLPKKTTEKALASRQPRISFYTNECYYVPGNLLMRDMRYASELTGFALTREKLYAHGLTERQAMGVIQPIKIETHPLNNPYLDYSVYLNNMLIPGIFILLVMLSAAYTIGIEWKRNTQLVLYRISGRSPLTAIVGKLLPQTLVFWLIAVLYAVCFYRYLQFPCNSGILPMVLVGMLTVLAAQGLAVFLFGVCGQMRLSMCLCSLWGILSFSLAGFTFPVTAMDDILQKLSVVFPLRHYYLLYVNQALNGDSIIYAWQSLLAMGVFASLPLLTLRHYHSLFLNHKYVP